MQRAAAQKNSALRLGHGEITHVLADVGVAAAQQRAVGGISYGFSPEGFSSRSNQVAISYLWTAVRGVRETRKFILIEMNGGSTHAIPLRQITGEQAEQLRGLLRTHVPKNVKLAKR